MSLSINTNIASLNAQRNLGKTQGTLNKSLQRLSSGLRINSAKDDAAGLAISNRMGSQVRGLNQAVRNANDAISLSQTAEGALQESTSILQRMRELSVQSANDTNTAGDRSSIQAEISQLLAELDRIAETTQFNGKNLLDGTMEDATFHVGANAGDNQTISFDISSAQTEELSSDGTVVTAPNGTAVTGTAVAGSLSAGELIVNGNDVGIVTREASLMAAAITAADSTVIATAINSQSLDFTDLTVSTPATIANSVVTGDTGLVAGELTVNGFAVTSSTGDATAIAAAINSAGAGVTATADDTTISSTPTGVIGHLGDGNSIVGYSFDLEINGDSQNIAIAASTVDTVIDLAAAGTVNDIQSALNTAFGAGNVTVVESGGALEFTATNALAGGTMTLDNSVITNGGANGGGATDQLADVTKTYGTYDLASDSSAGIAIAGTDNATKSGLSNTVNTYQVIIGDGTTNTTIDFDANTDGNFDGQVTKYEVAAAITSEGTYTASVNADTDKIDISKTTDDGTNMAIAETLGGISGTGFTDATYYGSISLDSTSDIAFTGNISGLTDAGLTALGNTTTTIDSVDVSTRLGATIAITSIDSALSEIDEMRGEMGAVQNRFESTISNLQNVSENISAARSRIVDADFAAETAALTKAQILQQAGIAMLAQANQLPQAVLSLLQ